MLRKIILKNHIITHFTRAKSYIIESNIINKSIQSILSKFKNHAIIRCEEIINKTV